MFKNRNDAGEKLAERLWQYKNTNAIVFALPRGGVPIGYYIAKHYNLPLELLLTKKIGHPLNEEVAIGAVSLDDYIIDDRHNIPESYIENEITRIRASLKERYKKFMGDREPVDVEGKIVIIVDDGIATGNTLLAALGVIRQKHPKKIVVAVPVAPREMAEKIKNQVDDFICLHEADDFDGVGQYYLDFSQVSDEEVIRLLKKANHIEHVL